MDRIVVSGGTALNGQIPISGAKNACLTLMPAALLSEEPLTLTNVPRLSDIRTMTELLESLGCEVASLQDGRVLVDRRSDLLKPAVVHIIYDQRRVADFARLHNGVQMNGGIAEQGV